MNYFEEMSELALRDLGMWEKKRMESVGLESRNLDIEIRKEVEAEMKKDAEDIKKMIEEIKKDLT